MTDTAESKTTCQFIRKNRKRCRRQTENAEPLCWDHARTLRHRWRSLTRNQSLAFTLIILSLVAAFAAVVEGIPPLYDWWNAHHSVATVPSKPDENRLPKIEPQAKAPARSPKKVSKPTLSLHVPGTGPDANGNWTATTEEFPSEGNSGTVFVYLLNDSDAPFDGGYLNVDYEKGFKVTSDHETFVHSFRLQSDARGITIEIKSIPPHARFQFNLTVSASQRFTVTDLHFQIEGEPTYMSTVTVRNGKDL